LTCDAEAVWPTVARYGRRVASEPGQVMSPGGDPTTRLAAGMDLGFPIQTRSHGIKPAFGNLVAPYP